MKNPGQCLLAGVFVGWWVQFGHENPVDLRPGCWVINAASVMSLSGMSGSFFHLARRAAMRM
jgi:hypothetical protein